MKEKTLKYNFGFNILILIGLFAIPVTLIFDSKLNVIAIGILGVGVIWDYLKNYKFKVKQNLSKLDLLYLFSFFLIQVIGLIYSVNYEKGIKQLETKFAFFLLPLVFIFLFRKRHISKQLINSIIIIFGLSVIIIFYLYLIPSWIFSNSLIISDLNKSIPNELGHVYFSIYSLFSAYSFYIIYNDSDYKWHKNKFLLIGGILLFFIPFILTARVASFLALIFAGYIILFDKKNRVLFIIILSSIILAIAFLSIKFPNKIRRFENIFKGDKFYNPIYHRKNNIECAFDIFKNNPLFGVGIGSVQPLLNECYSNRQYWGLKHNFNSHNEYLEEMARHGIIGIFNIGFLFIFPIYLSIRRKDYLYLGFILIIMVSCVTENIFSRQIGVVFFSFFNTMLFLKLKFSKIK